MVGRSRSRSVGLATAEPLITRARAEPGHRPGKEGKREGGREDGPRPTSRLSDDPLHAAGALPLPPSLQQTPPAAAACTPCARAAVEAAAELRLRTEWITMQAASPPEN